MLWSRSPQVLWTASIVISAPPRCSLLLETRSPWPTAPCSAPEPASPPLPAAAPGQRSHWRLCTAVSLSGLHMVNLPVSAHGVPSFLLLGHKHLDSCLISLFLFSHSQFMGKSSQLYLQTCLMQPWCSASAAAAAPARAHLSRLGWCHSLRPRPPVSRGQGSQWATPSTPGSACSTPLLSSPAAAPRPEVPPRAWALPPLWPGVHGPPGHAGPSHLMATAELLPGLGGAPWPPTWLLPHSGLCSDIS